MVERRGERAAAEARRFNPCVPVAGDLLVASVAMQGDPFDQTVVLLLDVSGEGALGVVLNRMTDTPVDEILPGWGEAMSDPGRVACGGPVSLDGALCLGRLREGATQPPLWRHSHGEVGLVGLDADVDAVAAATSAMRVFVGYAGWGPGQLQGEVESGLWHVLPSRAGDPFDPRPDDLWRRVLRRTPGELAYFGTWTADPELN